MTRINYSSKGIIIEDLNFISFDPVKKPITEVIFVSHPHSDHHPKAIKRNLKLISSHSTHKILKYKLKTIFQYKEKLETETWVLKQIPSGHMFGSTSLIIKNKENGLKILYTGDVNNKSRFGLEGINPPKIDAIIIEATYGHPKYVFPDPERIISEAYDQIQDISSKKIVFIHSYALGKAQTIMASPLNKLIEGIGPQIKVYNKLFSPKDVVLNNEIKAIKEPKKPGVYLVSKLPKKRPKNSVIFFFTGWALSTLNSYYAYPLSDHSDFLGLLEIIKNSGAKKVYTVFGYSNEFASYLRGVGIEAVAIDSNQAMLDF